MRTILLTLLSCSVFALCMPSAHAFWFFSKSKTAPAEQPADAKDRISAPELESNSCANKFDNTVAPPIPPADYAALADNLADELGMTDSQEQKLRELLEKHRQKYEEQLKAYDNQTEDLGKKRVRLVEIRDNIQITIDKIPAVVMSRLEDDQKRDYLTILEKQIAAEGRKVKKVEPPPAPEAPAVQQAQPADAKPAAKPAPVKKEKKKDERPKLAPEFEGFNLPL